MGGNESHFIISLTYQVQTPLLPPHRLLRSLALLVHPLLLLLRPFLLLPPLVLQHLLVEGARWRLVVLAQEALHEVCQLVNHHLGVEKHGRT